MSKKKVERFYDRVSKLYDASYQDNYWRIYQKTTWENLKRCLPADLSAHILDIGGGTGFWSIRIAKSGYRVVLADISQGMIDVAQQKCELEQISDKVSFVKCDICDMLEFQDETFDLVVSEGDPVSCCGNPKKAVKEIHRVLKRGGKTVCSVDNKFGAIHYFLERGELEELEKFLRTGWSHWLTENQKEQFEVKFFSPEEIQEMFEMAGFSIKSIIGKTVVPWKRYPKMIGKTEWVEQMVKIESILNRERSLIGNASHLEIVAEKK